MCVYDERREGRGETAEAGRIKCPILVSKRNASIYSGDFFFFARSPEWPRERHSLSCCVPAQCPVTPAVDGNLLARALPAALLLPTPQEGHFLLGINKTHLCSHRVSQGITALWKKNNRAKQIKTKNNNHHHHHHQATRSQCRQLRQQQHLASSKKCEDAFLTILQPTALSSHHMQEPPPRCSWSYGHTCPSMIPRNESKLELHGVR